MFKQGSGQQVIEHVRSFTGIITVDDSVDESDVVEKSIKTITVAKSDAIEKNKKKVVYKSEEYYNLLLQSQFFVYGKNLHFRMHPDMRALACIFGSIYSIGSINKHKKTCTYLQSLMKSNVKYKELQSISTNLKSAVRVYKSKGNKVNN